MKQSYEQKGSNLDKIGRRGCKVGAAFCLVKVTSFREFLDWQAEAHGWETELGQNYVGNCQSLGHIPHKLNQNAGISLHLKIFPMW